MKTRLLFFLSAVIAFQSLSGQQLVSHTLLGSKSEAELYAKFNNLLLIQFGADYYAITYTTKDVHGVVDTASGLVAIPNDPSRVYPRLVYQHGTSGSRRDVPSINIVDDGEGQLGMLFAGLGYVAILPDYLGLGDVSKGFHPYVHAASEASAAMDMLRATETLCAQLGVQTTHQLFITGYSQGGHAAMALHRAIEKDPNKEFSVTAAAPMSGPYSISGVMRQLILSDDIYYYPAYIPNTALSYQTAYGNLFQNISELFKSPYAERIELFYNGNISLSELNEDLKSLLIANEGACRPHRILQPAIVEAVNNQPDHPINLALAANDTYNNWIPQAPMRLYYCMSDDQVPFNNSLVARDSLQAVGAPNFAVMDVMPSANHGQCVVPAVTGTVFFFYGFQQIGYVGGTVANNTRAWDLAPNPVSNQLTILRLPAAGEIEVIDLQGITRIRAGAHAGDNPFEVGSLNPGVYLIKYVAEGRVELARFVVQR